MFFKAYGLPLGLSTEESGECKIRARENLGKYGQPSGSQST